MSDEILLKDPRGPIESFSWGKFIIIGVEHGAVEDQVIGCGKDLRLIGDVVSKWSERKGHNLNESIITGIFDQEIDKLVIGIGVDGQLKCPVEVTEYIKSKGIQPVILEKTPAACQIYNDMFHAGEKVALLVHGTC